MKIQGNPRGYHLAFELPEPLGKGRWMYFAKRQALLIRVVTDDGIAGWGETLRAGAGGRGDDPQNPGGECARPPGRRHQPDCGPR